MTLTRQQAATLCKEIDLDSDFFDAENRGWRILKISNPQLLDAYEVLFAISTEPVGENNVPKLKTYGESAGLEFAEMDELAAGQALLIISVVILVLSISIRLIQVIFC